MDARRCAVGKTSPSRASDSDEDGIKALSYLTLFFCIVTTHRLMPFNINQLQLVYLRSKNEMFLFF